MVLSEVVFMLDLLVELLCLDHYGLCYEALRSQHLGYAAVYFKALVQALFSPFVRGGNGVGKTIMDLPEFKGYILLNLVKTRIPALPAAKDIQQRNLKLHFNVQQELGKGMQNCIPCT